MTEVHKSFLCFVLKSAGPIFFMSMQLSYLQTASKILSSKSDCRLSVIPFVSLVTNCAVMTMYAVLKANTTVFIPNFTGLLAGLACVFAFQMYTDQTSKGIFIAAGLILTIAIVFFVYNSASSIGMIGVGLSVILMGAPLATLRVIVEEKSTASLPFATSITTFLNALCWSLYGVIEVYDPIIYVPNSIGLFLACIQLSLFVIYGFPPEVAAIGDYTEIKLTDIGTDTNAAPGNLIVSDDTNFRDESNTKSSLMRNDPKSMQSYV